MKKSYKLYGAFWDGKTLPDMQPVICIEDQEMTELRKLKLSTVLKNENPEKIDAGIEQVGLIIDFIPMNSSSVVWDFYIRRLLQISRYLNAKLICLNKDYESRVNQKLVEFLQKEKAPQRLLAQSDGAFSDDMLNIPNHSLMISHGVI